METEKGQITRIYNGEIITPERNFGVGTVLIAEGKIIGIEPGNYEVPGSIGHDAHGGYIAPGFIDLHTHGAGDSDFMDCTEEDCLTIAREHLRHGTTLLYQPYFSPDTFSISFKSVNLSNSCIGFLIFYHIPFLFSF